MPGPQTYDEFEEERRRRRDELRQKLKEEHRTREEMVRRSSHIPSEAHEARPLEMPTSDPNPAGWTSPGPRHEDAQANAWREVPLAGLPAEGGAPRPEALRAPPRPEIVRSAAPGGLGPVSVRPHPGAGPPVAAVAEFLAIDARESFDLMALNRIRFEALGRELGEHPDRARDVASRCDDLMSRVKQETDTPAVAASLLRSCVVEWYRNSPADLAWPESTPLRWAGLFAESRIPGGRLVPWVNLRLALLRGTAVRSSPWTSSLRSRLGGSKEAASLLERIPLQTWMAEAAQALLDDLASLSRTGTTTLPLVRLSELGTRRGATTLNQALAALLGGDERGPFILLHPNRYPECDQVAIKPPHGTPTGGALSYVLVLSAARPSPAGSPQRAAALDPGASPTELMSLGHDGVPAGGDDTPLWDREPLGTASWMPILREHHREKRRLESPPKDYRSRPSYTALRQLLLSDEEARKLFATARWRGRPSGLALLSQALSHGDLTPEAATDYEYLESELDDLDPSSRLAGPDGKRSWAIPGWSLARSGDFHQGYRYRAEARAG